MLCRAHVFWYKYVRDTGDGLAMDTLENIYGLVGAVGLKAFSCC
jgi:hypothetical protein